MAKMTKKELFTTLLSLGAVKSNESLVAGLTHELELLEKKKSSSNSSKITEEIKNEIYYALKEYECGCSLKELIVDNFSEKGYTSQKLVPVMKALINEGLVERTIAKRTAIFKVIG